jgi:hypothetical protein
MTARNWRQETNCSLIGIVIAPRYINISVVMANAGGIPSFGILDWVELESIISVDINLFICASNSIPKHRALKKKKDYWILKFIMANE